MASCCSTFTLKIKLHWSTMKYTYMFNFKTKGDWIKFFFFFFVTDSPHTLNLNEVKPLSTRVNHIKYITLDENSRPNLWSVVFVDKTYISVTERLCSCQRSPVNPSIMVMKSSYFLVTWFCFMNYHLQLYLHSLKKEEK